MPIASRKHTAFSLLELSVTLVIIGVIIFGVIQSGNMISFSRTNIARSLTARSIVPEISGLVAWYESSLKSSFKESESYDGAQLSTWYDNSPNSIASAKNTLTRTASSSVLYESSGINKIPTVKLSGTANFTLSTFYQGTTSQSTIFVVFQPSTAPDATEKVILDSSNGNVAAALGIRNNALWMNVGLTVTMSATFAINQNYVLAAYYNPSNCKGYVNDANTMTGGSVVSCGTQQLAGLTVGTARTNVKPFNGFLSEIIIYNRALSDRERKDVMGYLSKKYRITVIGLY